MNAQPHFFLKTFLILVSVYFLPLVVFPSTVFSLFAAEPSAEEIESVIDFEILPFSELEQLQYLEKCAVCKNWAKETAYHLKHAVYFLETSPVQAHKYLSSLESLLSTAPISEETSLFEGSETFTAQSVASTLKTRIAIWKQVLFLLEQPAAESYGTVPRKRLEDVLQLHKKTELIRNTFLTSQNGQPWIQFLHLTPLHSHLSQTLATHQPMAQPTEKYANEYSGLANLSVEQPELSPMLLSEDECRQISVMANNIFILKSRASMTPEQQQVLQSPLIQDWLAELEPWRADPLHPLDFLAAYESYKQYRGLSDGSRLSTMTRQMIGSKDPNLQNLGNAVQNEYSNSHLKVYISKYLINALLPKLEPEFGVVRENMAGQEVVGRRRADTRLHVTLIPDPNRMLMQLNINGNVISQTTASTFPATLHNQTHGTYSATKPLELTSRGILTGQANVTANSSVRLKDVETDLDVVPIVSGLIREIAKEQYSSQHQQIQADARAKVLAQAKQRIDSETDLRFKQLNERMDRFFFSVLRQRQASFEQYQAKTTEEWLLTSWYLATSCSLGSDSKEPPTPQGAIADMKVHESGINAALERFDLAGKQMTLRELKQYLLAIVGQPHLEIPEEENDGVVIGFATVNPVGIRFLQNRVELSLNLKCLLVENRQWQDFCVIVDYVPDTTAEGHCQLVRQGTVQLDGRLSLIEQVGLRTIFSKIFLQIDHIPLRPKLFDANTQFAGLTTGAVRIENGWFAVGLFQQTQPEDNPVIISGISVRQHEMNRQGTQRQQPQQNNRKTVRPAVALEKPTENIVKR